MKVYILILAVVAATVIEAVRDASTTSVEQRADTILKAVEEHCQARRKRFVSPRSDDKVRKIIYEAMAECLSGNPEPEPKPETGPPTMYPSPEPSTMYPPAEGPCIAPSTVNLTEDWRLDNKGSDIKPIDGNYNCDAPLFDNTTWFRITGSAGNMIRNTCSPSYSCGSHGGIWTNATMPTVIGQEVRVPLYGSWSGNCNWYPWVADFPLAVMRCSPYGDFVYKIDGLTGCYHSICGMWA